MYSSANASLDDLEELSGAVHDAWIAARPEVVSILAAYLSRRSEQLLEHIRTEVEEIRDLTTGDAARGLVGPLGPQMIRDTTAFSQGFMAAPHQVVQARAIAIRSRFAACADLANLAGRSAAHMGRVDSAMTQLAPVASAERVFIGHGQSHIWRELKDFIADDLHLPWDEFNRVSVPGITTTDRLA